MVPPDRGIRGKDLADLFCSVREDRDRFIIPGLSTRMTERGTSQHVFEVVALHDGIDLASMGDRHLVNHCDGGDSNFGGRVERDGKRATVTVYVD